jgi:transaldolase
MDEPARARCKVAQEGGARMNAIRQLREMGRSLWPDNIARAMLDDGSLRRYADDFCIAGLTSNPTIFDDAIGNGSACDTLCVEALAAPGTIDTMPEKTLKAFAEHGRLSGPMAVDGCGAEATLAEFARAGIDIDALALRLQRDGAEAFVKSWKQLLDRIAQKSKALSASRS